MFLNKRFFTLLSGLLLIGALFAWLIQFIPATLETVKAAPLQQTLPTVSFDGENKVVAENSPDFPVTIQLSAAYTDTVVVPFRVLNGSATKGTDFNIEQTSNSLTFAPAAVTTVITVTINDDSEDEPNENFYIQLEPPAVNATIVDPSLYEITITDNDESSSGTATPIFTDIYEPNNTLAESYTTAAGTQLCDATLWPTGDLDYFRFVGKAGSYYDVFTSIEDVGIDTALKVYNTQGNLIASNDDFEVGDRRSQVTIAADVDGFYYARIENKDPSDPANKTYCFEVREITPPTPEPSATPIPGDGDCEFNSTIETACTIGLDQSYSFDFVPVYGSLQDTDVFRIWMKPGIEYTCETSIPTGSFADTNMIFLDHNGNDFDPNLGNDDKEFGDLGSKLSYLSTYTGWLHVMIGPVNVPPYEEAPQHEYDLECTATIATATPTSTPTRVFTGGGAPAAPTATPIVFPTFPPTPTPIDLSALNTPVPPTPPAVQFQPLPTATPFSGGGGASTVNVTIYYDANENFMPELTEGVVDTAVALYENASGQLIAFGYTNEAGLIRFEAIATTGAVRVAVPFLNYTQIVTGETANILVRVAPQPLPIGIP